uniref:TF-B3 domain-containing protein n=1 Tax=Physcomitrium patens TaxID=3218 RepID=A9RXP5_PHYPA|nr:B3 domain-containing protein Os11g0197600-like [Physcomitrium patens]PNR41431.1 hypothetical protein PHYPA_018834 [Physcomitrium patens]|eukprot:XP_024395529.1 B3 domain-containing protein Os11g0197600-like [Physcomitrella patens]
MKTTACALCLMNCVRLHGDECEDADGASAPLPSFIKTMTELTITSVLQIPASFVRCSDSRIGKVVTLEGPSKENWSVEVGPGTLQRSGLEFRDGWQKFVADHNVQIGDHLFFTLKSYSRFQVMVYDESGSPKANATAARNSIAAYKDEPKSLSEAQVGTSVIYRSKGPVARPKHKVRRKIRTKSATKPVVVVGRSSDLELENSDPLVKDITNVTEIVSDSKPQHQSDTIEIPDSPGAAQPLLVPHVVRGGHVISERRAVTQPEKEKVIHAARLLADTLTNPKIVVAMSKAYVYRGFWMVLNRPFSKAYMPQESREVTLCNKAGHEWPVKWLFKETNSSSGFSGGWRRFSLDHRLEESDVCVFEIVDETNFVILVHIFRALGQPGEDNSDYRPSSSRDWGVDQRKRKTASNPCVDTNLNYKKPIGFF